MPSFNRQQLWGSCICQQWCAWHAATDLAVLVPDWAEFSQWSFSQWSFSQWSLPACALKSLRCLCSEPCFCGLQAGAVDPAELAMYAALMTSNTNVQVRVPDQPQS
jgi:hypothetical protein